MVHSLLPEANDRAVRLLDGGEKKRERSRRLSDRRQTDKLNSPVCMRREVCGKDTGLSSFPSLLWMVEVVGWSFGVVLSFQTLLLMIQVVQHHPLLLQMKVNWLKTQTSGSCH
ncbi:hypothetical protein VZT92_013003 [Zoarces viviparus]|uniref:Uncharacterized protein n=1 Tax=Zoarces viviparus TaxID=48416 RepID=A0AAW1F2G4_ZOAVI